MRINIYILNDCSHLLYDLLEKLRTFGENKLVFGDVIIIVIIVIIVNNSIIIHTKHHENLAYTITLKSHLNVHLIVRCTCLAQFSLNNVHRAGPK